LKYLYAVLYIYLLVGCSQKEIVPLTPIEQIKVDKPTTSVKKTLIKVKKVEKKDDFLKDLLLYPQHIEVYTKDINNSYISTQKKFEKKYFRVWNIDNMSVPLNDAMWAYKVFTSKNSYGENLKKIDSSFFDQIKIESDFKNYSTINKRAISLYNLNIRAFPTDNPVFMNPTKAGEGFPFDYMQNSTIAPNKPLFVSHYSKSKKWVFIESSFAFGWVKAKDIAFIDKKYTDMWQKAKQVFLLCDDEKIYTEDKKFLFDTRVGMLLPLINEIDDGYNVLTISAFKHKAYYHSSYIPKNIASIGIIEHNEKNINKVINGMKYTKYGWGGLFNQRDCSSTLRDFFIPFGVWLPRNSHKQSLSGEVISLDGLTKSEKIKIIKSKAIPFRTLLYKRGHIALYIGVRDDNVMIFQNVWGVKTKIDKQEGRYIIGKSVFSTLEIGKELRYFYKNSSMLSQLKSMSIF